MEYTFKIQFGDTDPAGIVYYPNYYRWMDASTHELLNIIGYSTRRLLEQNMTTPLVEANCVFRFPGYYHHTITVHTDVEYVKDKVFKLNHTFYDGTTVLAEGYEVRAWVSVNNEKMKAITIPQNIRVELEKLIQINV